LVASNGAPDVRLSVGFNGGLATTVPTAGSAGPDPGAVVVTDGRGVHVAGTGAAPVVSPLTAARTSIRIDEIPRVGSASGSSLESVVLGFSASMQKLQGKGEGPAAVAGCVEAARRAVFGTVLSVATRGMSGGGPIVAVDVPVVRGAVRAASFFVETDGVASNGHVFTAGGEESSYGSAFRVGLLGPGHRVTRSGAPSLRLRFSITREVWFGVDVVVPTDNVFGGGSLAAAGMVLGTRLPVARAAVSGCVRVYADVAATGGSILVVGFSVADGDVFDLHAVGVVGAGPSTALLEFGCGTTVAGAVGVVEVRFRAIGADSAISVDRLLLDCRTVTAIRGVIQEPRGTAGEASCAATTVFVGPGMSSTAQRATLTLISAEDDRMELEGGRGQVPAGSPQSDLSHLAGVLKLHGVADSADVVRLPELKTTFLQVVSAGVDDSADTVRLSELKCLAELGASRAGSAAVTPGAKNTVGQAVSVGVKHGADHVLGAEPVHGGHGGVSSAVATLGAVATVGQGVSTSVDDVVGLLHGIELVHDGLGGAGRDAAMRIVSAGIENGADVVAGAGLRLGGVGSVTITPGPEATVGQIVSDGVEDGAGADRCILAGAAGADVQHGAKTGCSVPAKVGGVGECAGGEDSRRASAGGDEAAFGAELGVDRRVGTGGSTGDGAATYVQKGLLC
jgi:hypothetical protein